MKSKLQIGRKYKIQIMTSGVKRFVFSITKDRRENFESVGFAFDEKTAKLFAASEELLHAAEIGLRYAPDVLGSGRQTIKRAIEKATK